MKHIGMDLHSTTTDACVRNGKGKIVLRRQIATTKAELEKFVLGIQGPKRVAVEESQMADWVTRVLKPHVDEVIRCQPRFNKLISESEDKCDKVDCESLSECPQVSFFRGCEIWPCGRSSLLGQIIGSGLLMP